MDDLPATSPSVDRTASAASSMQTPQIFKSHAQPQPRVSTSTIPPPGRTKSKRHEEKAPKDEQELPKNEHKDARRTAEYTRVTAREHAGQINGDTILNLNITGGSNHFNVNQGMEPRIRLGGYVYMCNLVDWLFHLVGF